MLFRVIKKNPDCTNDTMLGFKWIEVLAVIPFAQEYREDLGKWVVENGYLCRTELGIHTLHQDDLIPEIEEDVYVEEKP